MACEPETPTDVLGFLLVCAQEHLETRPVWELLGDEPMILVGAEGVSRPYGCCPGLLAVESVGPIAPSPENGPEIVNGCEPCDFEVFNQYKVLVKFCSPSFDAKRVDGSAVPIVDRNTAALALVTETWLLFEALRCCILVADCCPSGSVLEAGHSLVEQCAQFWTTIKWEHTPCC
jgi:hypothetical protein